MKQFFIKLTQPINMPHWWQDALLAIPRIISGLLLTLYFGSPKFGLPWSPAENGLGFFEVAFWFPSDVAEFGGIFAVFPAFFAWMAAFSEAVGGVCILVGLQTRVFAFLNICTMLVAIFCQQLPKGGMWNALPAMSFLWVCIFLLVLGSGKFSADYITTIKLNSKK